MIILIGLVILVAALVVGVAGVLANGGSAHTLNGHFAVSGYHVTGSTGQLFLYGVVVGAIGLVGLSLLLAGARRTARRGRLARRDLKQSRRQTASANHERNELLEQRDELSADRSTGVSSNASSGTSSGVTSDQSSDDAHPDQPNGHRSRLPRFGHRATPEPARSSPGNETP